MVAKVMFLISASNVSGPVKGVFQLIENLDPAETEISLYDFQYDDTKENLLLKAVREKNITINLLIKKNKSYFSLIGQVVNEIKKNRFELIQTHGFLPTFLGFFAKMICNVKWICFMHGATNENLKVRVYNLIDNILQQAAHRTVLVSQGQRGRVYGGRDSRRVHVLHNAVDVDHPMPMSAGAKSVREICNLPAESRIIVAVGRFSPEKGVDILLDALALLVRQINDVQLVLVGDGQERPVLESQVKRLGLGDRVHFAGYTKTPGDYVSGADILVLPSRSEGIPNVVLEAMAMGKPVVATRVGGVSEIIEDGISGRLVPPEQPDLLAGALAEVLVNHELYKRFVIEGRHRVQESFSIQKRVAKLQALYRDVLSDQGVTTTNR